MNTDLLQTVDWSRAQFAMTAIYHWLFVPLTLGLSILCAIFETRYYRTGDKEWKRTARFWMRLFGINFAIGVATGLILEFEFGTNWSNYSHFVGDIFGAPLAIEGIMAFFLESTFVAVMFFGWDKVSRGFHLSATWLTALGANISALWILVANSWMQDPVGMHFNIETMRSEMTSFWEVLFSPMAMSKFTHTVTSAYLLSAVFVIGVSAWYLLKGREQQMARRSIGIASIFGLVFALTAALTGDRSGRVVARVQPMKLAAMEGLYDGSCGAPATAFGVLRPTAQRTSDKDAFYFRWDVPQMLSVLSYGNCKAYVPGINDLVNGNPERGLYSTAEKMERGRHAIAELQRYRDALRTGDSATVAAVKAEFDESTPQGATFVRDYFAYFGYGFLQSPEQTVPPVGLLFYLFRLMVGVGALLLVLTAVVWWLNHRDRLASQRWLLYVCIWCIPLAYLGSQAGWAVAEVGRQPWVIQNLMPTCVAGSSIASAPVAGTFLLLLALFTLLLIVELRIMFKQIKIGPDKE